VKTLIQAPKFSSSYALRDYKPLPSPHLGLSLLHSTLPAAILAAFKTRIQAGKSKAVQELWEKKDKTYLAIDFEWSERNEKSALEWGYAAVRCGHLEA